MLRISLREQFKVGGAYLSEFSNIKCEFFLKARFILLYADRSCNLFHMFWYATYYDVSSMFYKLKNCACDVWNEFMIRKDLNSHEIDSWDYSPDMLCDVSHGSWYKV